MGRFSRLLPEFVDFHSNLTDIKANIIPHEPLDALVCFFNKTSVWADRGFDDVLASAGCIQWHERYCALVRSLEILQGHVACAGRTKFGWNRTKVGEVVTPDNVFLGNVYGLFTKPVSFWKQKRYDEKGGWGFPDMEHLNSYDVVAGQSVGFLQAHLDPMISSLAVIIETLSDVNEKK